jgi:NAD(P)-dependent dehydrogenase (short-subunit alcohol dehydrogenase family)
LISSPDLTTYAAADEITEAARAEFGRIDILANNAGIGPGSIRPDSWQRPLIEHAKAHFAHRHSSLADSREISPDPDDISI